MCNKSFKLVVVLDTFQLIESYALSYEHQGALSSVYITFRELAQSFLSGVDVVANLTLWFWS